MSEPIACTVHASAPATPAPGDIWPCTDACTHVARYAANPRKLVLPDNTVVCMGCSCGTDGVDASLPNVIEWCQYGPTDAPTVYPGFKTINGTWWLRGGRLVGE